MNVLIEVVAVDAAVREKFHHLYLLSADSARSGSKI